MLASHCRCCRLISTILKHLFIARFRILERHRLLHRTFPIITSPWPGLWQIHINHGIPHINASQLHWLPRCFRSTSTTAPWWPTTPGTITTWGTKYIHLNILNESKCFADFSLKNWGFLTSLKKDDKIARGILQAKLVLGTLCKRLLDLAILLLFLFLGAAAPL